VKVKVPAVPVAGVTVTVEFWAPCAVGLKDTTPKVQFAPEAKIWFAVQVPEESIE
jgi:hypothetical protein